MTLCPIISLAKQLMCIPSVSPLDLGCQKVIAQRLSSVGFEIENINIKDTFNLLCTRGKEGPTLMFLSHTDVVPPGKSNIWNTSPFVPTIVGDKLFGRGASDMKGAVAAMIVSIERFIQCYPRHKGRLMFLTTSDEESKAINGIAKVVEQLIKRKEKVEYCIIGEPSSNLLLGDVIKYGRRGSINAKLIVNGIQGHVAYPDLAKNPIHSILPFLTALVSVDWDKPNSYLPKTTIQITSIRSGSHCDNLIPGDILIRFNIRFNSNITDQKIQLLVEKLLFFYKLNYSIKWTLSARPFITKNKKLANIVINSVKKITGITPQLSTSGGTSDGRFISCLGSEIIELGPVNSTIHQVNENVSIQDLQTLSRIYQHVMESLLGCV